MDATVNMKMSPRELGAVVRSVEGRLEDQQRVAEARLPSEATHNEHDPTRAEIAEAKGEVVLLTDLLRKLR